MLRLFPYRFYKFICKIFCVFYLSLKVEGLENIPKNGPFILAGNHISLLDPVAFGVSCPRLLNYMAKDTLFKNPFFSLVLKACCVFPVKRETFDIGAVKEALKRLKNGGCLLVFPQGTRSSIESLGQVRSGVGFLARKSKALVVPAYVYGTQDALAKGAKFIKRSKVRVIFGKSLMFDDQGSGTDLEFSREVLESIIQLKRSSETG